MRTIERTGQFKRDYKKERKGPHQATLEEELIHVVQTLANYQALPEKHHDHALVGDWKDHRDCHIRPDLVMIYRKYEPGVLQLVRLGSHGELGL